MLGVGWTEMLVIGVVALIVIGPKELPALMQKLGRFAGTVRRMGSDFQRELNRTTGLNEVTNLRNAITQPLKSTTDAIRKEFNTTTSTGEVKPSGVLKPTDPTKESVVDAIHAAVADKGAGSAVSQPVKAAAATAAAPLSFKAISPSSANPPPTKPELVPDAKPKRSRKKADTGPVASDTLATPPKTTPVSKRTPAKRAKKAPAKNASKSAAKTAARPADVKEIESPAPAEAIAPEAAPDKPKRKRASKAT